MVWFKLLDGFVGIWLGVSQGLGEALGCAGF